jgi:hypothetical protein
MEMLAAMMSGALGGIAVRGMLRHTRGRWAVTVIGILGGWAGWWMLGAIGPADKAGPLIIWHMAAGAVLGGAIVALAFLILGPRAR